MNEVNARSYASFGSGDEYDLLPHLETFAAGFSFVGEFPMIRTHYFPAHAAMDVLLVAKCALGAWPVPTGMQMCVRVGIELAFRFQEEHVVFADIFGHHAIDAVRRASSKTHTYTLMLLQCDMAAFMAKHNHWLDDGTKCAPTKGWFMANITAKPLPPSAEGDARDAACGISGAAAAAASVAASVSTVEACHVANVPLEAWNCVTGVHPIETKVRRISATELIKTVTDPASFRYVADEDAYFPDMRPRARRVNYNYSRKWGGDASSESRAARARVVHNKPLRWGGRPVWSYVPTAAATAVAAAAATGGGGAAVCGNRVGGACA